MLYTSYTRCVAQLVACSFYNMHMKFLDPMKWFYSVLVYLCDPDHNIYGGEMCSTVSFSTHIMLKVFFSLNDNHGYLMWNLWGKKFCNKHWKIIMWNGRLFSVASLCGAEFKVLHYSECQNGDTHTHTLGQSLRELYFKSKPSLSGKINILSHCVYMVGLPERM